MSAVMDSASSSTSLPLVFALCAFQLLALEKSPLRSVTITCASPVETLVILNATWRAALVSSAILDSSMSLRTTWSRNSSAAPSLETLTTSPSVRTSKVRGSPSVSR